MNDERLFIDDQVAIPLSELSFRYARSSGPGGQHVQRTESKVELLFDLAGTPSLNEEQRRLAMSRLGTRIDQQGVLHLVSQAGRSQLENRADVIQRFQRLLAAALRPVKARRAT
ncbi:MAG TPA: aminoacyl-tRNA hydrolase, partial [Anaerolineae bacterium]|nr:aminoacyl-tRNA hydrolase [Anaerolineae bacterium]